SEGDVNSFAFHAGTTITLNTGNNATALGHIWYDSGHNYVMFATAEYGSGRVCAVGDSSPADDGTGFSGDDLYDGWNEADDNIAFLNGMLWLLETSCDASDVTAPDWTVTGDANLIVNPGNTVNGLNWDDATDAQNPSVTYSVYRDTTTGFTPGVGNRIVQGLSNSEYTDTGLTNGTPYYYRVSVENCVPLSRNNNLADEASGIPTGGGGSPLDISGYQIFQFDNPVTFTFPASTSVDPAQYIIIARQADQATFEAEYGTLPAGTMYFNGFDVIGGNGFPVINGNEYYELKDELGVTIETTYDDPGADPFAFHRNNPGDDASLLASWTSNHTASPGSGVGTTSDAGLIINEITDESAVYQTAYIELYYDAPAGGTCETGDTTAPNFPGGNSGISVADLQSGGDLNISWNQANDLENPDSVRYALYRDTSANFTPAVGNRIATDLSTLSYNDSGLTNGTTYYYTIQTYNCAAQQTTNTDESYGVPTDPALAPTLNSPTPGDSENSISWSSVTGSDEYRLYYATVDGGPYALLHSTTVTSYTHTGLTNGTTYYYVVKNYDAIKFPNLSNNSNQVSGTPTSGGSGCATDLIISEYVESGIEKYIEIYNGTGSAVDLSDYELQLYSNGSPTVSKTSSLSGNLNDGEVIVYKNSGASQYPSGIDAIAVDFSGDDAIALYKVSTTSLIDVIGQIGFDPGSFWGTSPTKTADATLVRKSTVTDGDANGGDAFDPATEWDGTVPVVYTNLGSHTMTCAGCDTGDLTAPDWTVSGVSNLVVTDPVTDGDLNLNWDDAADAENPTSIKYAVYRDTTSGFTPAVGNRIATGLTASSYNDSGLTNGTPYYYRIETYNCNANTRNNSDEGSGTPTAPAALTIYDVQYTTTQGAECYHSPEETNSVTLIGIVSAIKTSNSYVIAESSAPWHSIYVYDSSNNPAVGDEITITGTVDEYNGLTEITTVTGYNVDSLGNPVYGPYTQTVETIGGSAEWGADCNLTTEPYEGLLITLYNVEVSSPSSANGYWRIKDQGGTLHLGVDDTFYAETVTNGQQIDQITGILLYSYGYYRLNPRNAGDITFSSCNTGDVTSPDWTVAGDSNLVVTDPATGGALNLNWDDAADAENPGTVLYAVYRDTTSGFTPAVGNRIATALGTSAYNDSGLTNGLTYYYRIETYNCNANTRYNTDEGSGVPTLAVGKKWTIAVFMNGDNNLEGAAIEDFLEMSAVGSDANFDIVVQMDRIGGYDSSYDNWTTTKRFHITNGMTPTIANAVSDIGEANMGDGNTLVAFAEWVKDNYPAQHYAFIIWDHGDGWRSIFNKKGDDDIFKGASQDETNGWDYLDFTSGTPGVRGELGLAFDDILTYYGAKLDILGFDVCLDQMWENNVEAQDAFDYFVASEMSEWFDGWAYTAFLNDIAVANGNMTGAEVAQSIVDAYAAGESGSSGDTQSSVDLSQIPALSTAIDEFAIELMYNKTAYGTEIASARSNCFELDNDTPYYNQIDLYDFCLKLESESVPQSLKDKSIAVRNAVNAAVLNYYNRLPSYDTFGIGIYYPRTSGSYESDYDSTLIAATNNWDNFIKGEILTDPVILTYSTHTIDDSAGNGDGVADPGETVNMPVTLHNSGTSTATGISATLSTASTYITITSNSSTYPDITSGSNGTTNSNYSFSVDGACPVGTIITFTLDIVASAGYTNQDTFQVQIGTLPEIDISGWKLTQIDNGAFFTFPGGTAIPENGYLILGRNATQSEFEAHWGVTLGPNTVYVNSNNVCPQINGGETYKLEDDTSTMIDGVTGYTLASGNTIQRNNPGDDPTLSPSWSSSSYSSSTPGSGVGTPSNSGVVINEYSDASSYVFEYVELYYDTTSVSCSDTDVTAPAWPGGAVANLTVTPSDQTNDLNWDDAADLENPTTVKYAVYRDTTTGFTPAVGNRIVTALSASSYSDSGLVNGTTYFYRVETYNCNANSQLNSDEGSGTPSDCFMTDTTAPDWAVSGVSNITVVSTASTSLNLSWDQATDAENTDVTYDLYRSETSPVDTSTAAVVISDYSGLSYNNIGLTEGTTYYYKVVAKNCMPLERTGSDEVKGVTSTGGGSGCATDLIISEYIEGSSFEKYIEIYNGTGSAVDLSNYELQLYSNGSPTPSTTTPLSGTLNDGEVQVYRNNLATLYPSAISCPAVDFNGDDAVALHKVSPDSLIDVIGQIGTDPGSSWGTSPTITVNATLVRKSSVTGGDTNGGDAFDPATEWDGYPQDTVSYLGSHTMDCGAPPPCDDTDVTSPDWTVAGDANLVVTDPESGTALNLDWDDAIDSENSDSIRYAVYRSTETGFIPAVSNRIITALVSSTYNNNGLTRGTTYYYRIETYNCNANTRYNTDEGSGIPTEPAQAPTLDSAVKGDQQVSLTWSPVSGSDEYRLYYSTFDGGPYSLVLSTTANAYVQTGLTNGTTYYYVVQNYDIEKYPELSDNSNQLSATPNPPSGNDMDVSGWKVVNKEGSGGYTYEIPDNTVIPESGYLVIGRDATQSAFETFWGVTLGADVIYLNSNNSITLNGGEYFELQNSFDVVMDGPTGYTLQVSKSGQRTNPGDPADNPASWTVVVALTEANPGSGVGTSSNAGVVINEYSDADSYVYEFIEIYNDSTGPADNDPPIFAGLQTVTDTQLGGELELAWNTASDTTPPIVYNIYMSTTSGGQNFSTPDYSTSNLTYTVDTLTNGTTYYFVVRARDNKWNEDTNAVEVFGIPSSKFADPAAGDILINEFNAKGTERVEIYNTSGSDTFNLCNLDVVTSLGTYNIYDNSGEAYIEPGEYIFFTLSGALSNDGDTIT
ncbi:lamin tail domain-containing protein, partial [Candidatus Dependentiae bacterium]|nr:lamin tail domain-containing protein [Candidatus Dependentiae bacterium]